MFTQSHEYAKLQKKIFVLECSLKKSFHPDKKKL
jgi:hypothetical protein